MNRFLMIIAALFMCATTANADEPAPLWADRDYDWTGFYAGVNGGYLDGKTSNNVAAILPNGPAESFFGGIHGGYRHQIDQLVLGLALTVPLIAEDTKYVLPGFGFTNEVRHKGSVRGSVQAGLAFGRIMPFVSAGLGVAWMEGRETIGAVTSPWADATHLVGTVGAGVNVALDENWVAGFVYNHIFTSSETYDCGPVICGVVGKFSLDADVVAVTFERRFGAW